MLSKMVEAGMNIDSKGAEWLLLLLEEASISAGNGKKFKIREYFLSLKMNDSEIKAAHAAIRHCIKESNFKGTLTQFIKECVA